MMDAYVVKKLFREKNIRESQMINVIKYILAFLKYFVILHPKVLK